MLVSRKASLPHKAFAANQFEFKITSAEKIEEVVITVYPDGGMNRVHFFGLNA